MFWLARLGVAETLTEKIGHSMNSPSLIKTPSFKNKTSPLVSFRLSGKTFQSIYRTNKILAYWPLLVPSFEGYQSVFRKLLRNCENLAVTSLEQVLSLDGLENNHRATGATREGENWTRLKS